jgi:hypothetical protein
VETAYAVAAGLVVLVHLAFVVFAAAGSLLMLKWRRAWWFHLPAVAWAVWIEFSGGICPLTPLENELRTLAGLEFYGGDFISRYLFPILYPDGFTRGAQVAAGTLVIGVNVALYLLITSGRRRRPFTQ